MSRSRTIPCIALYPCGNSIGSWEFMSLNTKTHVRRLQWKLMQTVKAIIDMMNGFDEAQAVPLPLAMGQEEKQQEQPVIEEVKEPEETQVVQTITEQEGHRST